MTALLRSVVSTVATYPCEVIGTASTIVGTIATCYFFPEAFRMSDVIHEQCVNQTTQAPIWSNRCISIMDDAQCEALLALGSLIWTAFSAAGTFYFAGRCTRKVTAETSSLKGNPTDSYGAAGL